MLSVNYRLNRGMIIFIAFILAGSAQAYAKDQNQNRNTSSESETLRKLSIWKDHHRGKRLRLVSQSLRLGECKDCPPPSEDTTDALEKSAARKKKLNLQLSFVKPVDPSSIENIYPITFRITPYYAPAGFEVIRLSP
jgi:hypothetical protein